MVSRHHVERFRRICQRCSEVDYPDWAAFQSNPKISKRSNEIEIALRNAAKIVLITVHHGPAAADPATLRRVADFASEVDGGSELADCMHFRQSDILEWIRRESDPPSVDVDVYLSNWGEIRDPYHAIFGRVQGQAIAEMWRTNPHLSHLGSVPELCWSGEVSIAGGMCPE